MSKTVAGEGLTKLIELFSLSVDTALAILLQTRQSGWLLHNFADNCFSCAKKPIKPKKLYNKLELRNNTDLKNPKAFKSYCFCKKMCQDDFIFYFGKSNEFFFSLN